MIFFKQCIKGILVISVIKMIFIIIVDGSRIIMIAFLEHPIETFCVLCRRNKSMKNISKVNGFSNHCYSVATQPRISPPPPPILSECSHSIGGPFNIATCHPYLCSLFAATSKQYFYWPENPIGWLGNVNDVRNVTCAETRTSIEWPYCGVA